MPSKAVKAILIGLAVLAIIAAALLLFFNQRNRDTTPPTISISIQTPSAYSADDDKSVLLAGVTAYDEVDGDLSAHVKIRSVTPSADKSYATVIYVVSDNSANIGTLSHTVTYTPSENNEVVVPSSPVIVLTSATASIPVGSAFNPYDYISEVTDDRDPDLKYSVIYQSDLNISAAGTYTVRYRVEDSDGNRSEYAILTVTVADDNS